MNIYINIYCRRLSTKMAEAQLAIVVYFSSKVFVISLFYYYYYFVCFSPCSR